MYIFVRTSTGKQLTLDVNPGDTVESLAQKIHERHGFPVQHQRLLYAGKRIEFQRRLSDYNIRKESTLDLILHQPLAAGFGSTPKESVFPTGEDALKTRAEWKAIAEKGNFDADLHIVDPDAHYAAIGSLEDRVVQGSALFKHLGKYPSDPLGEQEDVLQPPTGIAVDEWILNIPLQLDEQEEGSSFQIENIPSLQATYCILLAALVNLDLMRTNNYAKSFFSILLERHDGTVAEMIKIERDLLIDFKDGLEVALTVALEFKYEGDDSRNAEEALIQCLKSAVNPLLDILGCAHLQPDIFLVNSMAQVLGLCRMIACILDFGMVSYAGSHASSFQLRHMLLGSKPFRFQFGNGLTFECGLRTLACLSGFLDTKSVWVFRIGLDLIPSTPDWTNQKKLPILTTIDVFPDIWGPVWAEAMAPTVSGENPTSIKKYHVSKGVIRPVRNRSDHSIQGAVKCHWYSWAEDYRRRFSTLFSRAEDAPMKISDKLLIGAELRENQHCPYNLLEYATNNDERIRCLGPKPSSWKLDGLNIAMQVAAPKTVVFQIEGEFKKVPETTIKQSILEKWSYNPNRANPMVLNNYYGVEISHCTGNARRVALKQIMLLHPVAEFLERQFPQWTSTDWGRDFKKALLSPSTKDLLEFWSHHTNERPLVGQLVTSVLETLDGTGRTDNGFGAALLYQNQEQLVELDASSNEWCGLLKDTYLSATYAIINDVCLECRRPDHTTSICNDEKRFTVLQTKIGPKAYGSPNSRLRIEPHKQVYKMVEDANNTIPQHMVPESSLRSAFSFYGRLTKAKELLDQQPFLPVGLATKVVLQATKKSYGGMLRPRDRNLQIPVDVEMTGGVIGTLTAVDQTAVTQPRNVPDDSVPVQDRQPPANPVC